MIDEEEQRKRVRKALNEMTPKQRQRGEERYAEFVLWMVANSGPPGPMGHLADLGYIIEHLFISSEGVQQHRPSTRLWILGYHPSRFGRPVGDSEFRRAAPMARQRLAGMRRRLAPYGLVASEVPWRQHAYALPRGALPVGLMDAVYQQSDLTFLYFIQAGEDGPIKIGISADLQARLYHLQTNNASPLHLRGLIPQSASSQEAAIHRQFGAERVRGEWFEPASGLVEWIAENAYAPQSDRWIISRKAKAWKPIASSQNRSDVPCAGML